MARDGIIMGALTFSLSLVAALASVGFAPVDATRKRNETEMEAGMTAQPYSGLWVTADGHIRHKVAGQLHYPRLENLVTPLLGAAAQAGHP